MRRLLMLALMVVWCTSFVLAEEYKAAKIKDVDAGKGTVTIIVGDKVLILPVKDDAKITQIVKGKADMPVAGGLAGIGPGRDAAVSTTKIDGKETVTMMKVEPMAKTKK